MTRPLACALVSVLALSAPGWARAKPVPASDQPAEPAVAAVWQANPIDRVRRDSNLFGHVAVRYWLAQDLLNIQQISSAQTANELRRFNYGMVEVASNYWFGSVRQDQLANIGALFGIGFAFGLGGFTLTVPGSEALDVNTHWLNIDLLKFRLLGDPEGPASLVATANYSNFQNGAVQISNFAGLGLGLEGKTAIGPYGDVFFKATGVPFPVSSQTSGMASVELGSRWYVAPNVALHLGYKGMISGLTVEREATLTGSTTPVPVRLNLWDVFHGPVLGTAFTF